MEDLHRLPADHPARQVGSGDLRVVAPCTTTAAQRIHKDEPRMVGVDSRAWNLPRGVRP